MTTTYKRIRVQPGFSPLSGDMRFFTGPLPTAHYRCSTECALSQRRQRPREVVMLPNPLRL